MRALLLLLWLGGIAAAATGFDHNLHKRDVDVAGKDPIACASCHRDTGGLARPDHRACFDGCHGGKPAKGAKLEPLCLTCHVDGKKVFYPPYTIQRDFALELGHKTHAPIACNTCHAGKKTGAHDRCAGCHDGTKAKAAMTACESCHVPGVGQPEPPRLDPANLSVTGAFSHGKHAARGDAARACTTCHDDVLMTDGSHLPRPTVATCAIGGCHDGKAAFGTITSCTKCHTTAPADWSDPWKDVRFLHGKHEVANCTTCHTIAKSGEATSTGHAACTNTSCHPNEFGAKKPKICAACHNGTEAWRHLQLDREPAPDTELGVSLDHGKHAGACASCHSLTTQRLQLRPPRGHKACATSGCHAATGGPAPQLGQCKGCHELGLATARRTKREGATWSVRKAFEHTKHGADCTSCHTDLTAPKVIDLATPPKSSCVPCHDGKAAFKLTGTSCKKCHA